MDPSGQVYMRFPGEPANDLDKKRFEAAEKQAEREEQRRLGIEQRAMVAASLAKLDKAPNPHGNSGHRAA